MAISPEQQNAIMRQRVLATAVPSELSLGTWTINQGDNLRVKLTNVGYTTRLFLLCTVSYTVGTTLTTSPLGFLNTFNRIKVFDYDGKDRVSAHPAGIWSRNTLRERRLDGGSVATLNAIGGSSYIGAPSVTSPSYGLAVGAATTSFALDIPLAYDTDAGDLRGMINTQTTVGEIYLVLESASALVGANDDTKVFNSGTITGTPTIQVTVIQEYLAPQSDPALNGAVPIPMLDFMTVNEIATITSNDNFAAGQQKYFSFPNVRAIQAIHYQYYHNSFLGGSGNTNGLTSHAIVMGGTTTTVNRRGQLGGVTDAEQKLYERRRLGRDMPKGCYFQDFVGIQGSGRQPVQTALLGNVQLGLTPAVAMSGNTFLQMTTEALYIKGSTLGALSASS